MCGSSATFNQLNRERALGAHSLIHILSSLPFLLPYFYFQMLVYVTYKGEGVSRPFANDDITNGKKQHLEFVFGKCAKFQSHKLHHFMNLTCYVKYSSVRPRWKPGREMFGSSGGFARAISLILTIVYLLKRVQSFLTMASVL